MDEAVLERAMRRVEEARAGNSDAARVDAALERSRAEIEALGKAAMRFEELLPGQVSDAVRQGIASEVVPVSRNLAEIRGLLNHAIRRLERIEEEVLAERRSRVEDLDVLVELVASGWDGIDKRLQRIEERPLGQLVVLPHEDPAASTAPAAASDPLAEAS
ncbi:MAG: hypothetical protein U0R50_12065 [Gaiellales bacterium]